PQPTSITVAASAGPRALLNPPLLMNVRMVRALPNRVATIARLCTPAHVRNRRRPSQLQERWLIDGGDLLQQIIQVALPVARLGDPGEGAREGRVAPAVRSEEHTSELQSRGHLVCRLLLEKKKESVLRPDRMSTGFPDELYLRPVSAYETL